MAKEFGEGFEKKWHLSEAYLIVHTGWAIGQFCFPRWIRVTMITLRGFG